MGWDGYAESFGKNQLPLWRTGDREKRLFPLKIKKSTDKLVNKYQEVSLQRCWDPIPATLESSKWPGPQWQPAHQRVQQFFDKINQILQHTPSCPPPTWSNSSSLPSRLLASLTLLPLPAAITSSITSKKLLLYFVAKPKNFSSTRTESCSCLKKASVSSFFSVSSISNTCRWVG